jgi:hypothetical protein
MIGASIMAERSDMFARIEQFELPWLLLQQTVEILRREGRFEVESLLFWVGRVLGTTAALSHIIVPKGHGVFQHPLQVRVDEAVMAAVCELIDPPERVLLAQVHTHIGEAFHSRADDQNSLDTPGYLSLVVPYAAKDDVAEWERWGFFECLGSQQFRRMAAQEIASRFVVTPDERITIHEVRAH